MLAIDSPSLKLFLALKRVSSFTLSLKGGMLDGNDFGYTMLDFFM